MAHIVEIKSLGVRTIYGESLKDVDLLYLHQDRLKDILCFCHSEEEIVELSTVYEIVRSQIIH